MKKTFIRKDVHVSELSLVRKEDRMMLYIFLTSLAVCAMIFFALLFTESIDFRNALMLISVPFLIVGLVTYVHGGMWKALIIAIAVPMALFFLNLPLLVLFFILFILIGCVGVVSVAAVLQRKLFYAVITSIEYLNIKDRPSLWDRLVRFAFNVPPNIDTRKITMEYNLKRSGIPVKELLETMTFAFMIGIVMWIYLSMNPAFMRDINLLEAPIYAFSLIMFIPLLVFPWTPFKSLNVRITTSYKEFSIYGGAVETLRRMALPLFAVFVFILAAVNTTDLRLVAGFIGASVLFNMLVVAASSVFFYLFFESQFVDDAVSKWKAFRSVDMMTELNDADEEETKELPGTPKRNMSDAEITLLR